MMRFNLELRETKTGVVQLFIPLFQGGCMQIGAKTEDWYKAEDGFKFHDIFHFTFFACLNWSPVTEDILGLDTGLNVYENGYRARILEEAIIGFIVEEYNSSGEKFFLSEELFHLITTITKKFKVHTASKSDWDSAINRAIELWEFLKISKSGRFVLSPATRNIDII